MRPGELRGAFVFSGQVGWERPLTRPRGSRDSIEPLGPRESIDRTSRQAVEIAGVVVQHPSHELVADRFRDPVEIGGCEGGAGPG